MTRPNPNHRVREAKKAREVRDWQKLAERNRGARHQMPTGSPRIDSEDE